MKRLALILLLAAAVSAQDEPKIYVHAPLDDLLALFPQKGAGYLISIEEYEKLRALAEKNRKAAQARAPVDARLVRGSVQGRLSGDRLELEAEYVAVSQADGASEIPFPVSGIAVRGVQGAEYAGGVLRFAGPGTYTVKVSLVREAPASADGIRRVAFTLPPAAAHAVTLDLPPRVEGEVGPIVRAFRSGDEGGVVTGYPDRRGAFRFWMRPRTRARRLDPIVSATFAVMASVGETRTLASTRVDLEVLRAPIRDAVFELARGQLVHALSGKSVKSWRLERAEPRDLLRVTFVQPVQDHVVLTLETELPRDDATRAALPFPVVRDAVRYRGTVGLVSRPEVRVTALRATGARRLDNVPKEGLALYEVYDPAAVLEAEVEAIAAETKAKTFAFLTLGEGGKSIRLTTLYTIAGKPLFRLEPRVPAGWILRGPVTLDGQAIPHRQQPDGRLVLEFPNGVNPGVHILRAQLDTDEVDWVPDDGSATFSYEGVASGLDEETGFLAVAADEAFRVAVDEESGLRRVGLSELPGPVHPQTHFAWAYERPGARVAFSLRRHEPQLTATVIQRARPRERQLHLHATAVVNIERAGVRELRVELPKGTGQPVDFEGALIKERQPPATDAETETWTLVFQRRIRGVYRLDVRFDRSFDSDRWDAAVPAIRLPDASESGFVVIESPSMTAVTVDRGGLREADVGELPAPPRHPPLEVLAYGQHPVRVTLSSQSHAPQEVVQAIALSAHIYGVVAPEGRLRCRAEYRVRNNDQPFLRCRLPERSTLVGALVDGQPIKPLLEQGTLKLPLARSQDRETPFLVAIVYDTKCEALDDAAEITVARPALDIDVLKTTYSLHLPEGYELTGHDGDMVPTEMREKKSVLETFAEIGFSGGAVGDASDDGGPSLGSPAPMPPVAEASRAYERGKFAYAEEVLRNAIAKNPEDRQSEVLLGLVEVAKSEGDSAELRAQFDRANKILQGQKVLLARRKESSNQAGYDNFADREVLDAGGAGGGGGAEDNEAPPAEPMEAPNEEREAETTDDDGAAPEDASRDARRGDQKLGAETRRNAVGEKKGLRDELAKSEQVDKSKDVPAAARVPQTKPQADSGNAGRPGGESSWQEARASTRTAPRKGAPPAREQARQPERALLSLDVQFLKPDNIVRLDSLAPSGAVKIRVARREVFDTRGYLGAVLGLAFGIAFLLASRRALLRVLASTVLLVAALHFAGLSFLSPEFAIGAAMMLALVLLLALAKRAPIAARWMWRLLRRIRWPRKPASGAAALLLLAAVGRAEEILVPYRGDDTDTIDRVFLPSSQYHELRKLAYPESVGRHTIVADAAYAAVRHGDDLTVTARYVILKETEATERIPLRLKDVAVTFAILNEEPATLAVDEKRGYLLVLKGKGRFDLELVLRPRLVKEGKSSSFAIPVRPVATASLVMSHDAEGFDLDVGALGGSEEGTYLLGPVATLRATWTPKTKGFTTPTAELRAETSLQCSIRDGFTAIAGRVRYSISGGTVSRVRVAVDPSLTIRHVSCGDLAGWEVGDDGVLEVVLSKPAARDLQLDVLAERRTERVRTETVPRFEPLDVLRDTGTITLETLSDLKLELTETQGLLRGTLPPGAPEFRATPDWGVTHSVHRYAVRPFRLEWRVGVEATRLRATTQTYLWMAEEEVVATVDLTAETERGPGAFELQVGVPPDYEVTGVVGPALRQWWVEGGRLHIARLHRNEKAVRYRITLRRRGSTAEPVPAPALVLLDAVRQRGDVQVRVADGLDVETGDSQDLLPVNLDTIRKPGTDPTLVRAYRYVTVPWSLALATRRERREMDALTITRIVPSPDRVRVEALVNFHVRRGLVDEVSFVVPVEDENDIVVVAPEKREEKSVAVDGGRRYTLVLRNATRGSVAATVTYHVPAGEPIRGVEPDAVSQLRRYVVVDKIADGEVDVVDEHALDGIEFRELPIIPPGARNEGTAATYVGTGEPYRFAVQVKTHEFEEVAPAIIHSAAAQLIVDRTGWTRALVSYRVYNRTRQFLDLTLPDGARLYSVIVAGQGVRPLRDRGSVLVPLQKVAIGAKAFDVDVVYAYEGKPLAQKDWSARLPRVAKIDVQRTTVSLYLPKGFRYDFDTELNEVDPAAITIDHANDLFNEFESLYVVADRGNPIQAQRALENATRIEKEVSRVVEQVASQTTDEVQLKQIEARLRALESLKRQRKSIEGAPADAANDTRQILDTLVGVRGQTIESYRVNDAYLEQNQQDENQDLKDFAAANRRGRGNPGGGSFRGPHGGIPPGQREPGDFIPPPPGDSGSPTTPDQQGGRPGTSTATPAAESGVAPFMGTPEATIVVQGQKLHGLDDVTSGLDDHGETALDHSGPGVNAGGAANSPSGGLFFNDGSDGDLRARTESIFAANDDEGDGSPETGRPMPDADADAEFNSAFYHLAASPNRATGFLDAFRQAAGRVSLRIDLPREGEVFHFATAGSTVELVVEAEEADGVFGEGLLSILLLGLGMVVLFGWKRK